MMVPAKIIRSLAALQFIFLNAPCLAGPSILGISIDTQFTERPKNIPTNQYN